MNHTLIDQAVKEFDKALIHLNEDFNALRVGRANGALVENILVESYGTATPLKGLSTISTPDAKTIQIQPWDKNLLSVIEKGISSADLGLNPQNDGVCIRISLPELTEERRIDLKKVVNDKAEEAKISMRNSRHKAHNEFKELKEVSEITEDDFFVLDKSLQEKLSDFTKKVDAKTKEKEEDIMRV